MASILKEARYLRDLLATMAYVEVEQRLLDPLAPPCENRGLSKTGDYRTLGAAGLRALILTAEDLSEVLEWVYGQCAPLAKTGVYRSQALDLLGAERTSSAASYTISWNSCWR